MSHTCKKRNYLSPRGKRSLQEDRTLTGARVAGVAAPGQAQGTSVSWFWTRHRPFSAGGKEPNNGDQPQTQQKAVGSSRTLSPVTRISHH